MPEHLTNADRGALGDLFYAIGTIRADLYAEAERIVARHRAEAAAQALRSDYGWTHVYADVERLIAARLEQQREALAAAILSMHPDAAIGSPVSWRVCQRDVTKLVREYQPGEGT